MIALTDFIEIGMDSKNLVAPFLAANNPGISDFIFSNLFAWRKIHGLSWAWYKDRFLLYSRSKKILYMPLGEYLTIDELLALSDLFHSADLGGNFFLFTEEYIRAVPEITGYFSIHPDANNHDYVYESSKMVSLRGDKLNKKRNLIRQFEKLFPHYKTEPLSPQKLGDCFRLAEKWCVEKTCITLGFTHEISALKETLDAFSGLELEGLCLLLDEKISAFSIFERLTADTAVIHFEKYDPQIKGLCQAINFKAAEFLAPRFQYINREQDLGLEGLKKSKMSYAPLPFRPLFRLIRKDR
ncbi:MAG: hypothetical protein A2096_11375 [Spirochaetes bacterium GWF1_41_5]|nr:MAG: hypothetical protein A2096_11375 [Spirochaetes bacterium GWF1_41_5]HBE04820.1 hypothetical protein [Spirochaetia bacterium]